MVNEIPPSPTLTVMDLPCPSSRLPYDSGSAYNMSHGFAHGHTKGFVYYISKEHARVSVMAIIKREHFLENFCNSFKLCQIGEGLFHPHYPANGVFVFLTKKSKQFFATV